ncbi:MAG: preprotein translocase subunit SecA [Bifidobacteriaceae bacterium]|jgi:preprotein translocase subunit SecA|nr:preprotein translocase subunit SecA [Bifidobacteriaceae bacterium]
MTLIDKILRTGESKRLKQLNKIAQDVNLLEADYESLSDKDLRDLTKEYKERWQNGESLEDLMVEAFASVREAAKRTLGQRHFDVQLMGGAALHLGNIAEMKTGEGKTLVATLAVYLNALTGKGVHVITVNDYLASYQSELMGRVYRFLGMTVGCIISNQTPEIRRKQYDADITYGTNNEFGFDYLRDNMAWSSTELVQREHFYAIVDEVDSILIDEARTPLIISGPAASDNNKWYREFARITKKLDIDFDYEVDLKKKTVALLESGIVKIEKDLGIDNLYESLNTPYLTFANNAIKAKELFFRDKDYIVTNGEVLIVDEHTGRVLEGRRYSEGIHQSIEAKENVEIKEENQTYATITLQNYFRMYDKLAGMTGTAETEAAEFQGTYNLGVIPIPTNMPMIRDDKSDLVFRTNNGKISAIIDDIKQCNQAGQPVLVGTTSVEGSEEISKALKIAGVQHNVLNAKNHSREAAVIAMAGRKGIVTVATNMAGRGTDIMLGGNAEFLAVQNMKDKGFDSVENPEAYEKAWPKELKNAQKRCVKEHDEVVQLGGLYVLGTQRHESRRIDNQLRGRSGRQGDPGLSRFYLSMEDELMRLFNSDMVTRVMELSNLPENMPLESKMVTKSILRAQTQVEARNFEIRKNVLKYDDVMNRQREVMYAQRHRILSGENLASQIQDFISQVISSVIISQTNDIVPEEWNMEILTNSITSIYTPTISIDELIESAGSIGSLSTEFLIEEFSADAKLVYKKRQDEIGSQTLRELERRILLSVLDRKWREHLYQMDYLREGISLRAMAQKDPLVEYTNEGSRLFGVMNESIVSESVAFLFHFQIKVLSDQEQEQQRRAQAEQAQMEYTSPDESGFDNPTTSRAKAPNQNTKNNGKNKPKQVKKSSANGKVYYNAKPNQPCPCGSDKKYKMCHGRKPKVSH